MASDETRTAASDSARPGREAGGAPRRVLVTGGAGFIGSHLTESLVARGDAVTVVDNLSTGRMSNLASIAGDISMIEANLRDALPSLAGEVFDEVYHLAAAVGVDLVLEDPIGSIETNIGDTQDLLRFCERAGKPRTLIASSSEVYGKPGTRVFSEEDDAVYGPTTITRWSYACTKAIDEHLALAYERQRGVPAVVIRFFNTVGPRQIGRYGMVLPRFVRAALAGETLRVFGDGEQTRCFCDVRDVVGALPRLLACPQAVGRVLNLGSDESISIAELAERVIDTVGSTSTIERIPYDDAYPAGFEDLRHRRPDLARVREAIGFDPKIALTQTIRDLAEQIRSEDTSTASADGAAS